MARRKEPVLTDKGKLWGFGSCALVASILIGSLIFFLAGGVYFAFQAHESRSRALVAEELARLLAKGIPSDHASLQECAD